MTSTLTQVRTPRTPPPEVDPTPRAEAALRTAPGVDTTPLRATFPSGATLPGDRVQHSSRAAAVGAHLRRDPARRDLHHLIGFHHDGDPRGRSWGRTRARSSELANTGACANPAGRSAW